MRFLVGINQFGRDPHVYAFWDHMKSIVAALRSLGHEVEYASEEAMRKGGRLILWGVNHLVEDEKASDNPEHMQKIPDDSIVFQTEQISAITEPTHFLGRWVLAKNFVMWDYSEANLKTIKKLGGERAVLCALGYHPSMTTIKPVEQDIDVLFYGTRGGPRREILTALEATNLNVVRLFGVYAEERDAVIARAKVVINLRAYEKGVFEIFRCSHLFANRVCVVNESNGRDPGLEEIARRCTAYTAREDLVERCRELVASPHKRLAVAERGFEEFSKINLVENVGNALMGS